MTHRFFSGVLVRCFAAFVCAMSTNVFALPGELDASFGQAGSSPYRPVGVVRGIPSPSASASTISTGQVAVRKDGGYYAANPCLNLSGAASVCVSSYTPTGSLENPFSPIVPLIEAGGVTALGGIAVDNDDNAWVSGTCNGQGCVAKRLRSGGNAAFQGPPYVLIPTMVSAHAIDIGRDGKVAVGGRCFDGSQHHPCAVRLLANGSIDPSFNGGSVSGWGNDPFNAIEQVVDGSVRKIKFTGDGRIYAGGRCAGAAIEWMCVAVLEVNGSRRLRFVPNSQDGVDVYSYFTASLFGTASSTAFVDMAVQTDGAALLYGTCRQTSAPTQFACVVRFMPDVGFDQMFGNNGILKPYLRGEPMSAAGLVLRQDGSFIVLANCDVSVSAQTKRMLCIQSHTPSGAFSFQIVNNAAANDIDFDPSTTPPRLRWEGVDAVRFRDNALLAVASCPDTSNFRWLCVAKISLGALPAPHGCSPDIDGDGKSLATTDAALVARVARAASGTAATANVVGAGAVRGDWASIRTHLNTQCGTNLP